MKPLARRRRDLCKLNGARRNVEVRGRSLKPAEEEPARRRKDESMAEVSEGGVGRRLWDRQSRIKAKNSVSRRGIIQALANVNCQLPG